MVHMDDFTAEEDIVACSIQVTNNANVFIPSGLDVTLNGRITVTSGSFTLDDNAHLVQITDVENIGQITVIQNSSELYRNDYTVWSSPVAGQNLYDFSPATQNTRFYTFGINGDGLEDYLVQDPFSTNFATARGYLIRMPNAIEGTNAAVYNAGTYNFSFEGIFTGVPNNGTIATPLSTVHNRISMVGNPYPSPINVQDFFDTNTDVLDPSSGIYFWRKTNNSSATSVATMTRDAYVANQAAGGGAEWNTFFDPEQASEWVINVGQGFYVQAKSNLVDPVLTFNYEMRRANVHNEQFFRTTQNNDPNSRYWVNLTGNNRFSQIAVVYSSTATLGIDPGRDAKAMTRGSLGFFSITPESNLVIQARPSFTVSDIVPVGFHATEDGTYTLTLDRFDGLFEEGQGIYLKDNLTGLYHDLKAGAFEFTITAGTYNERFEIVYTVSSLGNEIPVLPPNEVVVYKRGKELHIASGTALMSDITVFDTRGRMIYTVSDVNTSTFVIDQLQAEQQLLILNITTDKGKVSKKVIY